MNRLLITALVGATALAGCSSDESATDGAAGSSDAQVDESTEQSTEERVDDEFPDIVGVEATFDDGSETWSFAVTVSSPYDTPERYADGWRVIGPDGTVYGVHQLAHDHAGEQPFTRRQIGVTIPIDVDEVTVEGRDQANGFGGATKTVALERSS